MVGRVAREARRPRRVARRRLTALLGVAAMVALIAAPQASGALTFDLQWGEQGTDNDQFQSPAGVAVDSSGQVRVADGGSQRLTTWSSDGIFDFIWPEFNGLGIGMSYGIAIDSSDHIYVTDINGVQKLGTDAGDFRWGSTGSGDGEFSDPKGVAVDSSGDVYVADAGNNRIQKFDSDGNFITKWGSTGSGDGEFLAPHGIATDSSDNVYVADVFSDRIQKFDSDGTFITEWGSSGAADGQFFSAEGIATDSSDNVYVVDNGRIQKFDSDGNFIAKVGSGATSPVGIAINPAGDVYVADGGNWRIRKFVASAPQTVIDSGAEDATNDPTPTFEFSSEPAGADFECSLVAEGESVDFEPCSGPDGSHTPDPALPDDDYTFEVRAVDDFADVDPTPATRDFTVDTTAPTTTIDSAPPQATTSSDASFGFSSDEPGSSFECGLDGGAFAPCSSPKAYASLALGQHSFSARATDAAGNTGTAASRSWTVEQVPQPPGPDPDPDPGPDPGPDPDPDPDSGLLGEAKAKSKQRGMTVKLSVSCERDCEASASGKVIAKGKGSKLKPESRRLAAGELVTLKLKPNGKKAQKQLKRALKAGAKATAKLEVAVSDEAGDSETEALTVKLTK